MSKKIFLLVVAASIALLFSIPAFAEITGLEKARQYLESNPPGPRSAVISSLNGWPVQPGIQAALEKQFRLWEQESSFSPAEYELALLSLFKTGESLPSYSNMDLLSRLYMQNALNGGGLDGISGALLVYNASGQEISQSQPNSPNSLLDRITASQQESGGFAQMAGDLPDITVTARALTALYPYSLNHDIRSTIEHGLKWLASQQNSDGTFSDNGVPSGSATAEVLVTFSVYQPAQAFFPGYSRIQPALALFQNADGGYSETLDGVSSPEITELAMIAIYAAESGTFPYDAPDYYPEYTSEPENSSQPAEESPWLVYGKFFFGFIFVFFLIYLLLLITVKIGKFAEKKKLPGSLAAQAEKKNTAFSDDTIQIHIPMQAEIPNFDQIPEQESEIGNSGNTPSPPQI